jgi:CRISPR-associated protein Csb1
LGAKFQRALVSEIVGYDAVPGVRSSSRIDPLGIQKDEQTTIFATETALGWTLDGSAARRDSKKNEPVKLGDGKPSEINHGNVTPSIGDGGFTISKAVQTTTLSLPALRRLHFPANAGNAPENEKERKTAHAAAIAARTALAALGLCATTLAREAGCDLRSRCQLVATTAFEWEFLNKPGETEHVRYSLTADEAIKLLNDAVDDLRKHVSGAWPNEPIRLTPSDELLELVVRSQRLAAAGKGNAGESGG